MGRADMLIPSCQYVLMQAHMLYAHLHAAPQQVYTGDWQLKTGICGRTWAITVLHLVLCLGLSIDLC